jgi:exocyst complex component 4
MFPSFYSQKLRPTIHELIIAEIKARASAIDASRPRLDQISKRTNEAKSIKYPSGAGINLSEVSSKNGNFVNGNLGMTQLTGALPPLMGPLQSGQAAAQDLLESILGQVSKILGKLSYN